MDNLPYYSIVLVVSLVCNLIYCNVIDVVFVSHKKDNGTLDFAIDAIRVYGKNIRRIIVVSEKKLTDNAEWFDEAHYPFTKKDLVYYMFKKNTRDALWYQNNPRNRIGWIYQQLLKLYAPLLIPDISPNVLIIDADTIFLQPVSFIDEQGYALYNVGTQYWEPYFDHMKRLLPTIKKVFGDYSGITHHMLLQRHVIEDLFACIVEKHAMEPWQALCWCIDEKKYYKTPCLSEYEIYFNFVFSGNYMVKIRPLNWKDIKFRASTMQTAKTQGCDYISCHSYLR